MSVALLDLTPLGALSQPKGEGARWQLPEFQPLFIRAVRSPQATLTNPLLVGLTGADDMAAAASVSGYTKAQALHRLVLAPEEMARPSPILHDLVLQPFQAPPPLLPTYVAGREPLPVLVHLDNRTLRLATTRATVGAALASNLFRIGPKDYVDPAPLSTVTSGMHVYIRFGKQITIVEGDSTTPLHTPAETVGQALLEAGLDLGQRDRVEPGAEAPLRDGMNIFVTRLSEEAITYEEVVPHATVYRDDPELETGQLVVLQPGRDGLRYRKMRIINANGREASREAIGWWWERAPQAQIVLRGIKGEGKTLVTSDGTLHYSHTLDVYATWYNASHGGRSRDNPWYGITAAGVPVEKGIVAVDPTVIPIGTRMYIPGYGMGVAADTGPAIVGNQIDLAYPEWIVPDWRTGWVTIYILAA